ncbi:MAG: alanine racemase [Planctomycetes bacterium]|nr:alanine racemase [Planctomycetota bacterium]
MATVPSTWVEIDLAALANNVEVYRRALDTDVLVVVKADAYGHGAVAVARAVLQAGARFVGVVDVSEGLALRSAGIEGSILLLGPVDPADAEAAIAADLHLTCWRDEQLAAAASAAERLDAIANVHLDCDLGMSRFGADVERLEALLHRAAALPRLRVVGLSAHLPSSDVDEAQITLDQLEVFGGLVTRLRERACCPPIVHTANSAGAIRFAAARFDMCRVGLASYGVSPGAPVPLPDGIRAALTWQARVLEVRAIPAGRTVGYGGEFRATRPTRLAVLGVGYADGFRRVPRDSNVVVVRGTPVRAVGRICMQHTLLDVTDLAAVEIGDIGLLLGDTPVADLSAAALAARWGTNEWDVLCGIGPRAIRVHAGPDA